MNLQLAIPVLSKLAGRDVSPEIAMFFRSRSAVGAALDAKGQEFFMNNWRALPDFMETPEGQIAIKQFVEQWAKSAQKPEAATSLPAA